MKPPRFIFALLATLCLFAAAAHGQTIKSLGYNSTNGQIVAATNVTWTNSFNFSTNTVAAQVRTNLGLGWAALTNTNAANFREVIQAASSIPSGSAFWAPGHAANRAVSVVDNEAGNSVLSYDTVGGNGWQINDVSGFRNKLGLGLAALTNTSNVTAMRALSGSTNTNHPFSGTVSVVGTNNTNTLTFSNGILQSVQ